MKLQKGADFSDLLSLKVRDARADIFLPESIDDIVQFTLYEPDFHVLAGGTNIIAGHVRKPVLFMGEMLGNSQTEQIDEDHVKAYLPAGVSIPSLLRYAMHNGFSGVEFMAGIPGTLGGAVAGNAAPKGESWDTIAASIVYAAKGAVFQFTPSFSYRSLDNRPAGNFVILAVELVLKIADPAEVKQKIAHFASLRNPVPYPSAGSLFRNPMPGISAGMLLDREGMKGYSVNDAGLWEQHANIVINRGKAASEDFIQLRDMAMSAVFASEGIILEPEVRFWDEMEI